MPPLLSARTCWTTGWVAVALGLLAFLAPFGDLLGDDVGYGPDASFVLVLALSRLGDAVLQLGIALLVASVVLRHLERLRSGPADGRDRPDHGSTDDPGPRDHADLDEER